VGPMPDVGLAFGLGYFSHVALADALTITACRCGGRWTASIHLLPKGLRSARRPRLRVWSFCWSAWLSFGLVWLSPDIIDRI